MTNVITNANGQVQSLVGEKAVDAFRLRMLISGLRFEQKCPGMKMTRGVNCKKLARELTGLKTNDVEKLGARLQLMLDQRVSECLVVTDGE